MAFLATASLTTFVIECKCRRNLKKEKQLRNRKRVNELRRMKAAKSGNYGGFQRRSFNEPEGASNSADYINPFQYDERGEPIAEPAKEEEMA